MEVSIFDVISNIKKGFVPYIYFPVCILLAVSIRFIHIFLKLLSVIDPKAYSKYDSKWQLYWILWKGGRKETEASDYWFGTIIGVAELVIYPFLLKIR